MQPKKRNGGRPGKSARRFEMFRLSIFALILAHPHPHGFTGVIKRNVKMMFHCTHTRTGSLLRSIGFIGERCDDLSPSKVLCIPPPQLPIGSMNAGGRHKYLNKGGEISH